MDERHLLVSIISLLYHSARLDATASQSYRELCRDLLTTIKLPDLAIGTNEKTSAISALKRTSSTMADISTPVIYTKDELLQRLKIDCAQDKSLFDVFQSTVGFDLLDNEILATCVRTSKHLKDYRAEKKLNDKLRKASAQLNFSRSEITDFRAWAREIADELEPFITVGEDEQDPAIVGMADLSDLESITTVYEEVATTEQGEAGLKTGYQAINRMLRGYFRPGDNVVIGALPHQYKTGFSLTLFRQIADYNTPFLRDKTKKPLLIRISFEDNLGMNFDFLYKSYKQNETGIVEDYSGVPAAEKARYVKEKMEAGGFHIKMYRVDPSRWTYRDLIGLVLKLESQGYEIKLLMLDYLQQLPADSLKQNGPTGSEIRALFRVIRNFTNSRGIVMVSPHQLSTEAKQLIRDGRDNFVKGLPGKGYYDSCKTIDQEVDIELFIHIETINGVSYLTIQRGKHRLNGQTDPLDLYTALPFLKKGVILDDINKEDSSYSVAGVKRNAKNVVEGSGEKSANEDLLDFAFV